MLRLELPSAFQAMRRIFSKEHDGSYKQAEQHYRRCAPQEINWIKTNIRDLTVYINMTVEKHRGFVSFFGVTYGNFENIGQGTYRFDPHRRPQQAECQRGNSTPNG